MSISNNKKKRTPQLYETPSRVLLTCVYDTIVLEISNQIVFAKFSPFGTVIRILIFERGEVTKFFIEFANTDSAIRAKKALDGTKLYQTICKMNIYYSNFSSVDLKHQTTQGITLDYFHQKKPQNFLNFPDLQSKIQPSNHQIPIFNSLVLLPSKSESIFDTSDQIQQQWQSHVLQDLTNNENILASELQKTIENDINSLLRSQKKRPMREGGMRDCRGKYQNYHFLCFFIRESLQNQKIYNLFSNFGNISYIKQTKNCVFLKYKSQQFAEIGKSYLQGHIFEGNPLSFFTLSQSHEALPNEQQFSEITYYDQSFDRFTTTKSMTINPPSQTLHVSSLKREYCNVQSLREPFERYGRVQKIQILNRCADKNMALVKFATLQESFSAISELHGRNFGGRRMQISFTKSKVL